MPLYHFPFKKKQSFILVTVMLILSFIGLITQQLMRRMGVYSHFDSMMVARQKAQMIALGGINVAIASLTLPPGKKAGTSIGGHEQDAEANKTKQWLMQVLPVLNRWQLFPLTEQLDGMNGELKVCITCENGKLNLNRLFDFKKKEFAPEVKILLQDITFKGAVKLKKGEFFSRLNNFLKKRGKPLLDVSELLTIPGFSSLKLFYEPPIEPAKKGLIPIRDIALSDLFTLAPEVEKVDPWLFSDSMCALLGLRRPAWNDAQVFKETFNKVSGQFKKDLGTAWQTNWQIISPLYGKIPRNFNELQKILSQQFDPCVYTVISSGKVQNVEQKLVALIALQKHEEEVPEKQKDEQQEQKKDKAESQRQTFKVIRLYWL